MVGGGSPSALRKVQQRVIHTVEINYFNSADHAWTPFDCQETIPCVLCPHKDDTREIVQEIVKLMLDQLKCHNWPPLKSLLMVLLPLF